MINTLPWNAPGYEEQREKERYARYEEDRQGEARFFKDTEKHKLTVLKDDGLYRHLKFSEPGTNSYRFDLVTFPGYMTVTGDMGSYTFCRVEDMLEFFRTDRTKGSDVSRYGLKLHTNRGYWAQKLVAINCNGGSSVTETLDFDKEAYVAWVKEERLRWMREGFREQTLDKEQRRELWEAIDSDILAYVHNYDDEHLTLVKAYEFSWYPTEDRNHRDCYHFEELPSFKKTNFYFMWICNAIAWGVEQYDLHKAAQKKAEDKKNALDSLPDDYEVN